VIDLIFALFSEMEQQDASARNKGGKAPAVSRNPTVDKLQRDHERLKLVTAALWQMLKDKTGATDDELRRYVEQVDLMDGRLDGKLRAPRELRDCEGCGRRILNSAAMCLDCGERQKDTAIF
jgi:hypothetical protein